MALALQLVDTHVHINFKDFADDLTEIRERWQSHGITRLVHACVHPREFAQIQGIAQRFPEVSFAVGLHPLDADLNSTGWDAALADTIEALAQTDPKVVAIGETGLDFYKSEHTAPQIAAFKAQLRIARRLDLPVIIHCRDAAAVGRQVLAEINAEAPETPIRGVMHCWSGTPEETAWFLELGMYISFSGVVTYKNAKEVQASAQIVPSDRLLVETDCPFLAPTPRRGKRNEPAYVSYVAEFLAKLRGESLADLAHQTTTNAYEIFRLD
ncbi:MAG: TatD family hydrolase [Pseudanabaena sp. ELA607]